jgi:hypothetical protein
MQNLRRCHAAVVRSLMANIKAGDVRTFNETLWEPSTWPRHAQGVGFTEAPRGALAHWIVIDDGKISNYQAVVPSTWNAGPRDAAGTRVRTRRHSRARACRIQSSRSRSCARSTASIPALPARSTSSIRTVRS